MSNLRRSIYAALGGERDLTFTIDTYAGGSFTLTVYTLGDTATVHWGDGSTSTASENQALSHTYNQSLTGATLRIVCGGRGLFRLAFSGDGVNILSSNEKWFLHPEFDSINMANTAYTANIRSLPSTIKKFDYCFQKMTSALLPLRFLPSGATSMIATFSGDTNALLPFTNLPSTLVISTNAFSGCRNAVSEITELPSTLTGGGGTFYNCAKMKITLSSFPPGVTTFENTFANSAAVINLDEIVANAPAGGFQQLKTIANAFAYAKGVTGSQSRFLAACPNLENSTNAFVGTSTTA